MKKIFRRFITITIFFTAGNNILFSQSSIPDTTRTYKIIPAGPEYKASRWHKFLWGSNYRDVWTTPVTVKQLLLDTTEGGLMPEKAGGGHQTRSLHLKNNDDKEYSIRSVNKTLGKVLPEALLHTFIEDRVNDEVSMSNPYAAATVPHLAESAKIYHTNPTYVYVPKQDALKEFNDEYGNSFYLFEQRIDGNWQDADNLGNFKKYLGTEDLLDALKHDNSVAADQKKFIKARLFDMFINDWDRHEGQWAWGEKKDGEKTIYIPVPQDRDQAYSKHNGLLLSLGMGAGGLSYMQPFANNLKDVKKFNYEERNLDRRLANETTLTDWQAAATELQQALTDNVIETAVHDLPKEVYPVVGEDIIAKLKARRSHISEWATDYYLFLAKEVDVPGTLKDEEFDIERLNNEETQIQIFDLNKHDEKKDKPLYSRIFKSSETKEIRLFGLAGQDKYVISGNSNNATCVKIIGGINNDSVISISPGEQNKSIEVYDDKNNIFNISNGTKLHITDDTSTYRYKYDWFRYDKKGISPSIFYSYEDRLYVGLGYKMRHFEWGKKDFVSNQLIDLHYSLMENAFSINYKAFFPQLVAHSDMTLIANYNAVQWVHFFGLGNESVFADNRNVRYYTARLRQYIVQPSLVKTIGKHSFNVFANIQGTKIINDDSARFISKKFITNDKDYEWKTFAGGGISYSFQQLDDPIVPVKGVYFNASVSGAQNLKTSSGNYIKYAGTGSIFIPLISKFSLAIRAGAATVTGKPEFYQYTSIGGVTLRGYRRDRFWGKTAFYNTNDLRFISPVHSYIFNGKAGLLAFIDDGRVWMPGEDSNTWHTGVGGGIIVSPFNFLYADASYGFAKNSRALRFRFTFYFK